METRKTIVWDRRAIVAVALLFFAVLVLVWTSVFKHQWYWSNKPNWLATTQPVATWTATIGNGTLRLTWGNSTYGQFEYFRPDPSRWWPDFYHTPGFVAPSGYCDIPLTSPLCILATGSIWYLWRRRKYPAHCCQQCGYDLTGNVSGICPECGTPIAVPEEIPSQQPDAQG